MILLTFSCFAGAAPVPLRTLVDFERTTVNVNAKSITNFQISAKQLAIVNEDGDLIVCTLTQLLVWW